MSLFSRTILSDDSFGDSGLEIEEDYGSDIDDDLAELDNEVEEEASFGNGLFTAYGANPASDLGDDAMARIDAPEESETFRQISLAFNPSFLTGKWAQMIGKAIPDSLQKYTYISQTGDPEARDLARNFVTQVYEIDGVRMGADNWMSMTDAQKEEFVNYIIRGSIFLNHFDAGDKFGEAWDEAVAASGIVEKLKAAGAGWYKVAKAFWTEDIWTAFKGLLPTQEQNWNGLAYTYWAGHKWRQLASMVLPDMLVPNWVDGYPEIIASLNTIAPSFTATRDAPSYRPSVISETVFVATFPVEEMATGESGMLPQPQTILGIGYLVAVAPTLFKAIR